MVGFQNYACSKNPTTASACVINQQLSITFRRNKFRDEKLLSGLLRCELAEHIHEEPFWGDGDFLELMYADA